jgi:DDE superfamily endonuclease
VPYDKFRPENIAKAVQYLAIMCRIDPFRVIFGDEKLLRGEDLFNRMNRVDPLTGVVQPIYPDPDFRNTYSLTGFISINPQRRPITVFATDGTNNADQFWHCIMQMIALGELQQGDILVLDNAKYHVHGENSTLMEFLWSGRHPVTGEQLGILLILLPARTPEFNPIERAWHLLVKELKRVPLNVPRSHNHAVVVAALNIINNFSHDDMRKLYVGTNYLNLHY